MTALGLAVLILMFAPAGGAHFNPVVTAADWLLGRHTARATVSAEAVVVMGCQIAGAIAGTALAEACSPRRAGGIAASPRWRCRCC